jgi:ribosomal protein S18 acetylase RimI-like enzyme
MQIRELISSDAAEFQALRLQGLTESPSAFSSSYDEECGLSPGLVAERLTPTPERCVFGAFQASLLVGILGLKREAQQKISHKAFIWGMYVAPNHRKSGIGHALVSAALAKAACMQGMRQVNLGVNAANTAALALYEKCGFKPFGIERGFMLLDGQLHDEVHMVHLLAAT